MGNTNKVMSRPAGLVALALGGPTGMLLLIGREGLFGAQRSGVLVNDVAKTLVVMSPVALLLAVFLRQVLMRIDERGVWQPWGGFVSWESVTRVFVRPGAITIESGRRSMTISLFQFSDPKGVAESIQLWIELAQRQELPAGERP